MGLVDWLAKQLGGKLAPGGKPPTVPMRIDGGRAGCWWDHAEALPLAAGRGFTVDVVGESQWQAHIARVVGGKRDEGYKDEYVAQLAFDNNPHDANAVVVLIDAHPVGWIARGDAANVRNEINAINPEGLPVTCKAKIVGGWDRGDGDEGHFGVKLSLSRPIKVVPRQRLPT